MITPANTTFIQTEPGAIDSRRLQMFLAAAQTSSFAAAAERLSLTPSAVSHAIKALEEEFDCNLFKRHGPRVTLTRAGIRLMPLAEELLTRMARLRHEVATIQGNPRSLRVMMPECFASSMLPKVLPDFMECFPLALFEIAPGDADEESSVETSLVSGELDLLISYNAKPGRDVVRRDLFHEALALYVAPFHSLARKAPLELSMFEQYPLALANGSLMKLAKERLFSGDFGKARIWQMPSVESARELARVGQAVALLPQRLAAKSVSQGHLVPLRTTNASLQWSCAIHWSGRVELSWAAEVFVSLVAMVAQEGGESAAS
ncbi:DNA-binding transcriptional LysR family regulator [Roseimicrobium gellanilyticum]|uniref:DNA-binding transcriptional LysR family regulator n=1 Tax=Roseimicrobium gellanilyticum TaxID=748857 RepID=A0A366HUU0_9BACT|nr:LysR family transcriptional regulator [Roseimicrobium gellanilyticum]RBP47620.1 DNA-binding transcriptional LysR family regulator [Roseimicrobium gellanilyticum]